MSRRLLWVIAWALILIPAASAQTTDPNPGHEPSVFLGNRRPKEKKNKTPTSRSVTGKVVDGTGQPLEGALVTLTDTQKNDKLTFITKKDGRYNFDDLSFTVDYELQARYRDLISDEKKLSQYDHDPKVVRMLEVKAGATASTESNNDTPEPKR
ncbi:MAG: carboxypeptidase regulatory-like domain-containing protein [Acidobacteriaceae bacterium]|nr:carboxypeptidase regulatory-like domain-containing protein [Acidobacteriaceae bacterium]